MYWKWLVRMQSYLLGFHAYKWIVWVNSVCLEINSRHPCRTFSVILYMHLFFQCLICFTGQINMKLLQLWMLFSPSFFICFAVDRRLDYYVTSICKWVFPLISKWKKIEQIWLVFWYLFFFLILLLKSEWKTRSKSLIS